jgi:hypothetical protein
VNLPALLSTVGPWLQVVTHDQLLAMEGAHYSHEADICRRHATYHYLVLPTPSQQADGIQLQRVVVQVTNWISHVTFPSSEQPAAQELCKERWLASNL